MLLVEGQSIYSSDIRRAIIESVQLPSVDSEEVIQMLDDPKIQVIFYFSIFEMLYPFVSIFR